MNYIEAEIKKTNERIKQTEGLLRDSSVSDDLKELAKKELDDLKKQKEVLEKSRIKTKEDNLRGSSEKRPLLGSVDENRVIMEIRAGTGGREAGLFAADLYRMYSKFAKKHGLQIKELSRREGGLGDIREVVFEMKGRYRLNLKRSVSIYDLLKHESGVHRVQRIPITESGGRVHTSTATVAVLPVLKDVAFEINPKDLKMDTFRSSGHGGQNVNKVETAVRITHIPTGIVSACQEERSQFQNRERAMELLRSKLFTMMVSQQKKSIDELRSEQVGTGERSEKIRTYNFPQNRITDHRIKKSWGNLEDVLDGDLEDILKALNNGD